jgi:hypothetical protein
MIRWRDNQNIVRIAAKAVNAMAAAVFLGVDSMISMYFVFVFPVLSAQMTVVNIPTTITLSAMADYDLRSFQTRICRQNVKILLWVGFLTKAIIAPTPPVRMTCVIECLFTMFCSLFVVRCSLFFIDDDQRLIIKRLN